MLLEVCHPNEGGHQFVFSCVELYLTKLNSHTFTPVLLLHRSCQDVIQTTIYTLPPGLHPLTTVVVNQGKITGVPSLIHTVFPQQTLESISSLVPRILQDVTANSWGGWEGWEEREMEISRGVSLLLAHLVPTAAIWAPRWLS